MDGSPTVCEPGDTKVYLILSQLVQISWIRGLRLLPMMEWLINGRLSAEPTHLMLNQFQSMVLGASSSEAVEVHS